MITHTSNIRVHYSDTDQMHFAHHSNYVKYFEDARWELLRSIGISYKTIEETGIIMPVVDMQFKFIKPAFYDDELTIVTSLTQLKGARIRFTYKMYNAEKELINETITTLAFVCKDTYHPCHPPESVTHLIHKAMEYKNQTVSSI